MQSLSHSRETPRRHDEGYLNDFDDLDNHLNEPEWLISSYGKPVLSEDRTAL